MIDMGNRFRLLVNEVEAVDPKQDLPKLPVARVLWKPLPDMRTGCAAWILAGGAHHTVFSQNLTTDHIDDFASMSNSELVSINKTTSMRDFKNELRWNELSYR
jgi:L-arabinose isomerase